MHSYAIAAAVVFSAERAAEIIVPIILSESAHGTACRNVISDKKVS